MQRALKITARDLTLSDAFDAEIREKAAALDVYYNRITGCDVTVGAPVDHHRRGGPLDVKFRLTMPGKEPVATRQSEEGLAAAIREAFEAIRRQLEHYVWQHRGNVKAHEEAPQARVLRLLYDSRLPNTPDGREIYFHRNSVLNDAFDRMRGRHARAIR